MTENKAVIGNEDFIVSGISIMARSRKTRQPLIPEHRTWLWGRVVTLTRML